MKVKVEDFTAAVSPNGYMLAYKGVNIGGAGTCNDLYKEGTARHWKVMQADMNMYKSNASIEISHLCNGTGQPRFTKAIFAIERDLSAIGAVTSWATAAYPAGTNIFRTLMFDSEEAANAFLEYHPLWGVLLVHAGKVHLALLQDKGVPASGWDYQFLGNPVNMVEP